ncbi:MAG: stage II sporulation protein M [Gorillibacterium sp.]|nr:stage II sporulation protein M [Gorillibacterium sp.]
MKPKDLIMQITGLKKYIAISAFIFILGIVLGYLNLYEGLMESTLNNMKELVKSMDKGNNQGLRLFGFIILNNLITIVLIIFSGALFAFIPIYFLIMNGMIIGYLAGHLEGETRLSLVVGILPHGIFELTAVVLAGAFGIRFGFLMIDLVISLPIAKAREKVWIKFKVFIRSTIPLIGVLFVLLLIAAVIEVTVTPWLLGLNL